MGTLQHCIRKHLREVSGTVSETFYLSEYVALKRPRINEEKVAQFVEISYIKIHCEIIVFGKDKKIDYEICNF